MPAIQTASMSMRERRRWAKQNPYLYQLQQQRKAANQKRKAELAATRVHLQGDPVRGVLTPWVESLDSGGQNELSTPPTDEDGNQLEEPHPLPTSKYILNYGLTRDHLEKAIAEAEKLARPLKPSNIGETDEEIYTRLKKEHDADHEKRAEAVRRITALENGNTKNRLKANIARIVEEFGRHTTDHTLPPRPKSLTAPDREPTPRGGPDTGSSEVQIAILTAKIRALSQALEKTGLGDKHNKRNLRLLVHKRQKLLKYMFRRERGSSRWTSMIEKLGITDACWKREISL